MFNKERISMFNKGMLCLLNMYLWTGGSLICNDSVAIVKILYEHMYNTKFKFVKKEPFSPF